MAQIGLDLEPIFTDISVMEQELLVFALKHGAPNADKLKNHLTHREWRRAIFPM